MSEQSSVAARSAADIDRLRRAAETLTPLERNVLGLSAGKGMLIREIALTLGLSERRTERIFVKALYKFDMALHEEERPWWHFW